MTCRNAAPARPLESIRAEIDQIDDRILELVARRAALADEVRRAKTDSGAAALRPAREAQMLQRLAARDRGEMALEQVWRLWRELIMANARLQFPFTVDTVAASRDLELWDLGRAHFCFETDMEAHPTAEEALERTAGGPARVALLPARDEAWWRRLARADGRVRIFAALPMIAESGGAAPRALLASDIALQPCGSDITVIHIEASRGAFAAEAVDGGLARTDLRAVYSLRDRHAALVGVAGFLDGVERAPAPLSGLGPELKATIVGAHCAPVVLEGGRNR